MTPSTVLNVQCSVFDVWRLWIVEHSTLSIEPLNNGQLLSPISGEPLPRVIEPASAIVLFGLVIAHLSSQIEQGFVDECLETMVLVNRCICDEAANDLAPCLEPAEHLLEMDARAVGRTEVCQEQRVRIPRENSILADAPGV